MAVFSLLEYAKRAKNVRVRISLTNSGFQAEGTECAYHPGSLSAGYTTLTCTKMMKGQWVMLINKTNNYFHLKEVEVHGY